MCNGLASACIYRERSSRYGEKDQATEFLYTLSLEYFNTFINDNPLLSTHAVRVDNTLCV